MSILMAADENKHCFGCAFSIKGAIIEERKEGMLMKRIVFVTNNEENFENARRYLDHHKISLIQHRQANEPIPNDNLQDAVASKVKHAFRKVEEPCFVVESYFSIEALNGFPGLYTKYVFDTLGIDGLLRLMQGIENRRCVYHHCLGYYDGTDIHFFFDEEYGTLIDQKVGDGPENAISRIFIPDDFQAGLSDCFRYRPKCIEQFAHYLNEHTATLIENPYENQHV